MKTKTILFVITFIFFFLCEISSQTIKTIQHGATIRKYMEFIPASYNGNQAVPLLLAFHGLGDTITNFYGAGFQILGEIDNFITVYPQGMQGIVGTAWNAGVQYYGISINGDVNDIGFINALLDTLISQYNIDQTRIYATGFSMGGFMVNRIACQLSHRFAAVACAAGSRGNMITSCTPWRPVPYLHLHGNQDGTVPFSGNPFGMDPPQLLEWWVTFNQCQTTPVITPMPNTVDDGIEVIHYEYLGGNDGSIVEFYLADGGNHQWLYQPVNDVNYTTLIWEFLKRFSITNLNVPEIENAPSISLAPTISDGNIVIFTNPSINNINLQIFSISGQLLLTLNNITNGSDAQLTDLPSGIYYWKAFSENNLKGTGKIIIQK